MRTIDSVPMSRSSPPLTPTGTDDSPDVDATPRELLALLNDEYATAILAALRQEPKSARTLAEECGMSRPTVYRRLNRLVEAGIVESNLKPCADGRHRNVFEATLDAVSLTVTGDGLSATVSMGTHDGPQRAIGSASSD
jgi:DNA-binding transcriptional ArsR family regulator